VKTAFAILALGLAQPVVPPTPPVRYGTVENPPRHGQFQTMRALAHALEGAAQEALEAARGVHATASGAAAAVASLERFGPDASAFHRRMDSYETERWDVPTAVAALDREASRVRNALRKLRDVGEISKSWSAALDALSLMKKVVAGLAVQVPAARRRLADYERDYAPFPEGADQGYEQYQRKRRHGGTDDPDYHSKPAGPEVAPSPTAPPKRGP